jgi:hypothetical protein
MAKSGKSRAGTSGSNRRRNELRRTLQDPAISLGTLLQRPELAKTLIIVIGFFLLVSIVVGWSREQVLVREGQIMTETRLKRIDYAVVDERATEQKREEARRESPRMYRPNSSHLERLEAAINGLPTAADGRTTLDEMSSELVEEFQLTVEMLAALQDYVEDGEPTRSWTRWTERLIGQQLIRRPLLRTQEFQRYTTRPRAIIDPQEESPRRTDGTAIELRLDALTDVKRIGCAIRC